MSSKFQQQPTANDTDPHKVQHMWRLLHVLFGVLVVVLWFLAVTRDHSPQGLTAAILFAAVFGVGEWVIARSASTGIAWTWLGALALSFGIFVVLNPDAAFLAFPLFFVVLHVVDGWSAALAVLLFTLIAVAGIATHRGWEIGAIIGPVIAALVALSVGWGFQLLLRESRAREEAMAQLISARAEATRVARESGENAERARVAADIHDTVAQGLTSIQLLLHSAEKKTEDPEMLRTLQLARSTAAENLQETRRIIAALQPAPLTGASLPVALARVCSTTPMGNQVHFHIDGEPRPLPEPIEASLVRLAQSLLSNVVRHAHAEAATVTLTYDTDSVSLDVVDNGVGCDPAKSRGFGLAAAYRRVSELGGTLEIESAPNSGCGVRVTLPAGGQS